MTAIMFAMTMDIERIQIVKRDGGCGDTRTKRTAIMLLLIMLLQSRRIVAGQSRYEIALMIGTDGTQGQFVLDP